ncbi:MAG: transglutaminase-like domain-containing protein [Gemmatimonadota bacterium]
MSDGVQLTERLGLDVPVQKTGTRSQFTSQYTLASDLRLREFRITTPGAGAPVIQHGTIEGDTIAVVTPGTGEPSRRVRVARSQLIPPIAATIKLALDQKLRVGTHIEVPTFDPVTLTSQLTAVTVLDDSTFMVPDSAEHDSLLGTWVPVHFDTLRAWVVERRSGAQITTLWVDSHGLPLRTITPGGLTLDRSAFEIVTINYRNRKVTDARPTSIIPRTTISSNVSAVPGVRTMRAWLSAQGTTWHIPGGADSTDSQFMSGDVISTREGRWDTTGAGYEIPASDTLLPAWRAAGPLLGVGDPALAALTRSIAGDVVDPVLVSERLVHWVSSNISRTAEPVTPAATTVLRRKTSDVDGHTLLFVAMARSAGIPARTVSGFLLAGDRFYFHSWAEVYLGRWIPVDPTWNEFPAGAGRVRIGIGTLARPMDLLPMIAGIDAQLLSLDRRP